jgi:hypothetical protein
LYVNYLNFFTKQTLFLATNDKTAQNTETALWVTIFNGIENKAKNLRSSNQSTSQVKQFKKKNEAEKFLTV